VVELGNELAKQGSKITAVRIDSGDLVEMSHLVRKILNDGGHPHIKILVSGGLDEYRLADLTAGAAPIDGFGIGTSMNVSADVPYLDYVYKLEEYAGVAKRKRSAGKSTWPGRKQVYREFNDDGTMRHDILTIEDDVQRGTPLIKPVMRGGKRLSPSPSIEEVRKHVSEEYQRLPANLRRLEQVQPYDVMVAESLRQLTAEVDRQIR